MRLASPPRRTAPRAASHAPSSSRRTISSTRSRWPTTTFIAFKRGTDPVLPQHIALGSHHPGLRDIPNVAASDRRHAEVRSRPVAVGCALGRGGPGRCRHLLFDERKDPTPGIGIRKERTEVFSPWWTFGSRGRGSRRGGPGSSGRGWVRGPRRYADELSSLAPRRFGQGHELRPWAGRHFGQSHRLRSSLGRLASSVRRVRGETHPDVGPLPPCPALIHRLREPVRGRRALTRPPGLPVDERREPMRLPSEPMLRRRAPVRGPRSPVRPYRPTMPPCGPMFQPPSSTSTRRSWAHPTSS